MPKLTVQSLPAPKRLKLAKAKMIKLVDHAIHLIELFEANEIINFSDTLSKQIPISHAANAFNVFQDAMFKFEVVRLCVLWDPARPDDLHKESIPSVVQLVADPSVLKAIKSDTRRAYGAMSPTLLNPSADPSLAAIERNVLARHHRETLRRRVCRAEARFSRVVRHARHLEHHARVQSVRNFRDKHLAHSLSESRLDSRVAAAGGVVANMRYSDARWLYRRTLAVVNSLYLTINGAGFDWDGSIEIARRNATTLWTACTFQIPRRRGA